MRRCARCHAPISFAFDALVTLRRATYVHQDLTQCQEFGWPIAEEDEPEVNQPSIDGDLLDFERDPCRIEWDQDWLPDDPLWLEGA